MDGSVGDGCVAISVGREGGDVVVGGGSSVVVISIGTDAAHGSKAVVGFDDRCQSSIIGSGSRVLGEATVSFVKPGNWSSMKMTTQLEKK